HRVGGEWRYSCNTFRLTPEMPQCLGKGVSITAYIIDPIVWGHVRRVLLNPQHIAQALEHWRVDHVQQDGRATAHLTAVEGQLARLQAKAANLTAGVAEAGSVEARTVLLSTLDQVSKDMAILSTERDSLLQDAAARADITAQMRDVEAWAGTAAEHIDTFTYQQKRTVLYALGVRVNVWRKGHTPRYEIVFDFEGLNAGLTEAMLPITDVGGHATPGEPIEKQRD
ncbi:MAG TPA: hypothetical protein VMV29_22985, partial [Ktedonobacterales bacterium]|nr:hypothetical protein [Ktedonobacterales bacterium]